MKHLMKYLTTPLAFAAVFLLFGTPSAPGMAAVEAATGVSTGVGGCAHAFYDPDPTKDPGRVDSDGDGYPDTQDACPNDATNTCDMCGSVEYMNNAFTESALVLGGVALLSAGVPAAALFLSVFALGYGAASYYIQNYYAPECF